MVVALGPQPNARSVVQPQASARLLPLRHLQTFTTPDALDAVLANLPAVPLEQRRAAVSIATVLAGQRNDGSHEHIFVLTLGRLIALRAAWLVHQPARPSLAQALLLSMIRRASASLRA